MDTEMRPEITQFINLQSDYGFKRAFGTEKYKTVVIRFLQAALGDDIMIQGIEPHKVDYHDKEVLPAEKKGKRIVYDVYFTLKATPGSSIFKPRHMLKDNADKDVRHHFILEMQNIYEPPFEDRATYYLSKIVAGQGKAGWDYDLDPVILIGITDFDFPHLTRQLVQEFELREKTSGESLTKKLRILFYSLKQIPSGWNDCTTDLQRQLFIIKNMENMNKDSKPYKEGVYEYLFDAAESGNLANEEIVLYSQSLSKLRATQAGLDFKYEEGRAEGRAEGRDDERRIIAQKMKNNGMDILLISNITGLSSEQIMHL